MGLSRIGLGSGKFVGMSATLPFFPPPAMAHPLEIATMGLGSAPMQDPRKAESPIWHSTPLMGK